MPRNAKTTPDSGFSIIPTWPSSIDRSRRNHSRICVRRCSCRHSAVLHRNMAVDYFSEFRHRRIYPRLDLCRTVSGHGDFLHRPCYRLGSCHAMIKLTLLIILATMTLSVIAWATAFFAYFFWKNPEVLRHPDVIKPLIVAFLGFLLFLGIALYA